MPFRTPPCSTPASARGRTAPCCAASSPCRPSRSSSGPACRTARSPRSAAAAGASTSSTSAGDDLLAHQVVEVAVGVAHGQVALVHPPAQALVEQPADVLVVLAQRIGAGPLHGLLRGVGQEDRAGDLEVGPVRLPARFDARPPRRSARCRPARCRRSGSGRTAGSRAAPASLHASANCGSCRAWRSAGAAAAAACGCSRCPSPRRRSSSSWIFQNFPSIS